MSNSVDPDETAHMSRLIWIYAVCKCLLHVLSPVAVKELMYLYTRLGGLCQTVHFYGFQINFDKHD